ncbi:hypothetical protein V8E36_004680 [Tilletia maclaganii]
MQRAGPSLARRGMSHSASTNNDFPESPALTRFKEPDWTDEELGLHLDTTLARVRLYAQRRIAQEQKEAEDGSDVHDAVLLKLKDADTDDFFLDFYFNNPTEILQQGYVTDYRGTKDLYSSKGIRKPPSDFINKLLVGLRARHWTEADILAFHSLLDIVAYSVLRESGLSQARGISKPPYDPRWKRSRDWQNRCYDNEFHPYRPVRLDTPTATNAWQALFEDQLELARPEVEVGLLSSVLASFVTSASGEETSAGDQAATAGYRISLLLTLTTGVVSLRVRSGLSRLNRTAAPVATREEKAKAKSTLATKLLEYCQRVGSARREAPLLLSVSAIILQIAIFLFLASFVTGIRAQSTTPGDNATFGVTLILTVACAAFLAWTLWDGLAHLSVFSGGQIDTFLRALCGVWTNAARYIIELLKRRPLDLPTFARKQKLDLISRSESLTFFRLAAGVDQKDRADLVGAAVYQTLVEHCPDIYSPSTSVIPEGIQNLVRLGCRPMQTDIINCAIVMFDRDFGDPGAFSQLDDACRLMAINLKFAGEKTLADQASAAAALFRAKAPEYEGSNLRSPAIFQAISDVPADEHLAFELWNLRRFAWDVHMRRRMDLWTTLKRPERLFARFVKPCGHKDGDPDCEWVPEPIPFFLQHARRLALGKTYDEHEAEQEALKSGPDRCEDLARVGQTTATVAVDPAAASAGESSSSAGQGNDINDLLRLIQLALNRVAANQASAASTTDSNT